MTMGHYATALIPYAKEKGWPLWLLLVCAQLGDILWLVFAITGLEPTSPPSFLDVSIAALHADMLYSHGLVPVLAQAAIIGAVVFAVWRKAALAAWSGALVVAHLLEDYLCGWKHEIAGHGSPRLGLGLYDGAPGVWVAFLLEGAFAALCVWWYVRTRKAQGQLISAKAQALLYAAFVGGCFFFAANGQLSMRQLWERL